MANSSTDKDSEEDQLEFAKADVEEVEDNLIKITQKNQRTLSTQDLNRISGPVKLDELSTSVLRTVTGMKKSQVRKSILEKESSEEEEEMKFQNEAITKKTAIFGSHVHDNPRQSATSIADSQTDENISYDDQ